jgi:NADPH-dependent curcumin reductase CurA
MLPSPARRSCTVTVNRQWLLKRRPEAAISADDFEFREVPLEPLSDGEARLRVLWLSFDPAQRGWINESPGYVAAVAIGAPMRAGAIAQVVESRHAELKVGDLVQGTFGWQDYVTLPANPPAEFAAIYPVRRIRPQGPMTHELGVYGITGLTAYFGMLDLGEPGAGDTVVVSGAAGATGSVAGQIAKLKGARVIGIAGGPAKCRFLTERCGFDAAIDYRNEKISKRLKELAPDGIDVFYDNVGGEALDAALVNLAKHARVVLCGGISSGYGTSLPPGPKFYMQLVIRSATMRGFLVLDFKERFPQAIRDLSQWVAAGRIHVAEDIVEGFERAPATLRRLFEGGNLGKQLLKVADPPLPVRLD